MADEDKYFGFGAGYGPHATSKYDYYGWLLGHLDLEVYNEITNGGLDSVSCYQFYYTSFVSFQEWCRDVYEEMKDDQDKAYYYFRDILVKYQLSKKHSFYEKDNNIFNVLISKPISKEGNETQQVAFIIYEYLNLAINCLEDYVTRLKSPSQKPEQIAQDSTSPTLQSKSKLHGFNVKHQACLKDAYYQLVNLEIITKEVSYLDFEKAFLGQLPENKITWLKGPGLLSYFIKEINGIGIRNQKKTIWKTTIGCFKDKDGTDFEVQQLRHGKVPKDTEEIQMVIDTFNQDSYQEE